MNHIRDAVIAIAGCVWIAIQLMPDLQGNLQARKDLAYWDTMDTLNGGNYPFEPHGNFGE